MKDFEFKSQICTTKEQSERLLQLGLKKETADCQYAALIMDWKGNPISNPKWRFYGHNKGFIVQNFEQMECIPAWSLHRLICLYEADYTIKEVYNNAEECYGMLISAIGIAIEEGYFNKDYLEEKNDTKSI